MDDEESDDILQKKMKLGEDACERLGLPRTALKNIWLAEDDWAFVILCDSLTEATCREIISIRLRIGFGLNSSSDAHLRKFASGLNVNGRASINALFKALDFREDPHNFINFIREIRNEYSHDFRRVGEPLELIIENNRKKDAWISYLNILDVSSQREWVSKCMSAGEFSTKSRLYRFAIFTSLAHFMANAYLFLRYHDASSSDETKPR